MEHDDAGRTGASPGVGPALVVATCNLLHGIVLEATAAAGGRPVVDLAEVAAHLAALDADVLLLQEVDRHLDRSGEADQVAWLAHQLGWHGAFAPALLGDPDHRWSPVPAVDPGGPAYGVGILSRLPLEAVERVPLPGGGAGQRRRPGNSTNPGWDGEPRVGLRARVRLDGAALTLTTTHLSYLPWRALAQLGRLSRGAGVPTGVQVLAGDLNLPARVVRRAVGAGWTAARTAPTYPSWRPRMAVDQLLVRGGARIAVVSAGPALTSDHLPVVARVQLPALR